MCHDGVRGVSAALPEQEDQLLEGAALRAGVLIVVHCSGQGNTEQHDLFLTIVPSWQ